MKIVIDLTDKDVEFLQDEDVDTLFHCCGQGATGTDQNMELQKRLEFIIKEPLKRRLRHKWKAESDYKLWRPSMMTDIYKIGVDMKIVIELTDKDVEFLQDEDVDTLFHCCGQGATGTDQNMELQKRLEFIIKDQITAEMKGG